jgi:hypothetical protein
VRLKPSDKTNHTGDLISGLAGAVNGYIASRARHFISAPASSWTWFVHALMLGARPAQDGGTGVRDDGGARYHMCVVAMRQALNRRALQPGATPRTLAAAGKLPAECATSGEAVVPGMITLTRDATPPKAARAGLTFRWGADDDGC